MRRILLFLLGFITGGFATALIAASAIVLTAPDHYTVLVIGSDQRGTERARSDVLFVVSLPKSGTEAPFFFTIPRDTKIDDAEYGLQKITHFYAFGERADDGKLLGNVDLTQAQVERLLDTNIDATVEVTFQSFEDIVATIGGATIDGQTVTEQQALAAIRDRFSDGRSDFDRQADARQVLRSLLTKVKSPSVAEDLLAYFDTSDQARLQFSKVRALHFLLGAGIARRGKIEIGEMEEASVPGSGQRIYTPDFGKELYYWVADEAALAEITDQHFH